MLDLVPPCRDAAIPQTAFRLPLTPYDWHFSATFMEGRDAPG